MKSTPPQYNNLGESSPTKRKLLAKVYRHYPDISEKDKENVLSSIKRFVNVVKKIRTEPQAHIVYKERKIDGKVQKIRTIETDIEELVKVKDNPNSAIPIKEAMERLAKHFPETNYGKRKRSKKL